MPEFTAPGLGKRSNVVTVDVEVDENASGVLYAVGGGSGGLALFMDQGKLVYEYNMLLIERYRAEVEQAIPAGKHTIEIETTLPKPGAEATVAITIDGDVVARTSVKKTVPAAFTASETFDVGMDLGSPVSLDYAERRPFKFDGKIKEVSVRLKSP
jgi:arylsulfatase